MKKQVLLWLIVAGISLLPAEVIQSLVGADSLSLGTPFSLVIKTDFPLAEVVVPDSLTSFRVNDTDIKLDQQGSVAELKIIPLRVGALSFPKLELKARGLLRSGGHTDGFRVFVLSTRAEADTLLRDIKPPLRYRWEPPFWLYLSVVIGSLVLATLLIIMALRKRAPRKTPEKPIIVPAPKLIPPYKTALDKLSKLESSGLAERDVLAYHYELSMILREFLEHTYHFSAIEMTMSEIADSLNVLRPEQSVEFLDILRYCDLVKFAKLESSVERIQLQTQALRLALMQYAQRIDA
jgi:hypothetical protein